MKQVRNTNATHSYCYAEGEKAEFIETDNRRVVGRNGEQGKQGNGQNAQTSNFMMDKFWKSTLQRGGSS